MDFTEVISDVTLFTTVKEYCENGNMQVKGNAVKYLQLDGFSEMSLQSNSLIKTSENNLKSK